MLELLLVLNAALQQTRLVEALHDEVGAVLLQI
jgi:hypothetical protein